MEVTLLVMLHVTAIFFTYLSYSKNVDRTKINQAMGGLLWMGLALNSFVVRYYLPNGSASGYTPVTDNSDYWLIIIAVLYGCIGVTMWYQLFFDNVVEKEGDI